MEQVPVAEWERTMKVQKVRWLREHKGKIRIFLRVQARHTLHLTLKKSGGPLT